MTQIEIVEVLLLRGDEWALIIYRYLHLQKEGKCAGCFGCKNNLIVPGQIYHGTLKHKSDTRTGFRGKPAHPVTHRFQHALKFHGVPRDVRSTITSSFKPIQKLFRVIENKLWIRLNSLPGIGDAMVERIIRAYVFIQDYLQCSKILKRIFPNLYKYMSDQQREAAMQWMDEEDPCTALSLFTNLLRKDPFRIIYDNEFDMFPHTDKARDTFIKATTHASRVKMAIAAAADLGISEDDPRRGRYKAIETIKRHMTNSGDYWMPRKDLSDINTMWPIEQREGYVTLSKFAKIEYFIRHELASVRGRVQPPWRPPPENAKLDDKQRQAVRMACVNPVFILQGGAGVGKTSVCKHIVESLHRNVTCAAPTGKAAQQLKKAIGKESFTVHRLYYKKNQEVCPTLLLDEQSMQDLEILAGVLYKYKFHKIIFVGDTGQLTSVGPGQLLKDLCSSDIPKLILTHIYRSGPDSYIAHNGQKIRDGNTSLDISPTSFEVFPFINEAQIVSAALAVVKKMGTVPMVLCNTNREIASLNLILRNHFNPLDNAVETSKPVNLGYVQGTRTFLYTNWKFATKDSVINVSNKYIIDDDKTVLQVANGDIGKVLSIKSINGTERITVQYPDETVTYEGPIEFNEYLRPAYALTVNKAQGSEYDVVIVKSKLAWGDKRERFYTAVTRAKKKCIIYEVGSANNICIRAKPATRKTFLLKNIKL